MQKKKEKRDTNPTVHVSSGCYVIRAMWSVAGPYRDYLPTNTAIIFVCVMGGGAFGIDLSLCFAVLRTGDDRFPWFVIQNRG